MSLLDSILAVPSNPTATPPLEPAPESIFRLDADVELTPAERDWLDCTAARGERGHEGALNVCMADFRRGGGEAALRRARAVLQHLIDSTP